MRFLRLGIVLAALGPPLVLASNPCPLLGPGYTSPVAIASNGSKVAAAWANFSSTIDSVLSGKVNTSGLDFGAHSFSVGMFSVRDLKAQQTMQYHHTSPSVANSTKGVKSVNGDSVYRIGSLSKLLTAYLTLIKAGSSYWDAPITKYIPELATAATKFKESGAANSTRVINWEGITLGALAGHLGGLPRDTSSVIDELAIQLPQANMTPAALGLPKLDNPSEIPVCETNLTDTCTRAQYLQELLQRQPTFQPDTTPTYSNAGYNLLGLALERITGEAFSDMLSESLTRPLGMSSTSFKAPRNLSHAVIPSVGEAASFFGADVGNETASGGMYSTLNDLNRLGVSVLNSTLLCPRETRAWMKPGAHTASLEYSVGKPWEIYHFRQPATGRINDLYTKEGDVLGYSSFLILSPDHDAGFSILATGPDTPLLVNAIADLLTDTVLVALEAQAAAESKASFAGMYSSSSSSSSYSSSSQSGTNSTIVLDVDPSSGPGLRITSWTSNGTNVLKAAANVVGGSDIRLYPTNLEDHGTTAGSYGGSGGATTRVAFRAVFGGGSMAPSKGPFTSAINCDSWLQVDSHMYGKVSVDLFLFDVGQDGKATAVEPAAWRTKMNKH